MALTDGLQGFWKLNDNLGDTVVLDYSGHRRNGVASSNTSSLSATGKIDKCLSLDVSNPDYARCSDIAAVDLAPYQDISFAVWAKFVAGTGTFFTLVHKVSSATALGWVISYDDNLDKIRAHLYYSGGSYDVSLTSITGTDWHLFIVTIDRDGNMVIYLDDGSTSDSIDISAKAAEDCSNTEHVEIGKDCEINANFYDWNGFVDCVAVWNRVLTSVERLQLWNSGAGTEDFGLGAGVKPIDDTYTKQLVTIAGNELWYEEPAGTMIQLAASAVAGELDCTVPLSMFELYGKVFIVNGTRKKVYDPINVKITTSDLGTNPPDHGNVLTGAGGAEMIVDYITNLDDNEACVIYGRLTTVAVFANSEAVAGTDNDGNSISFTTSAAQTNPPHWYNWTPYGDADGTRVAPNFFGKMPEYATMGCNYQGRATISGNKYYPHQWYMARQENPFDFIYGIDDAQSAVAGNDADAGEIGDVVRALVPRKDDYLIFGCVNTIWYLVGNPCDGGTILELDLTSGIFGPLAWCFDSEDNFYYMGTNGLMRCKIPGTPVNISDVRLPGLVDDENIDPSTHRVTLHYDRKRVGILLTITSVADGTNSNYWYDLRTIDENNVGGLFPEAYPEECSVFSGCHYEARDPDYRKLILGCNDGYLRYFLDTAKSDVLTDDSVEAIDSYVTFGPLPMGPDPKLTGKLTGLDCVTAGTLPSGGSSDSDGITFDVWVANSAAKIIELLIADASPNIAGTIKSPGRRRGSNVKRKVKGVYVGVKLQNNVAAKTWAFEQLMLDFKRSGRLK